MSYRTIAWTVFVLAATARAAAGQEEPEVLVDVTRNDGRVERIYEGQSVDYQVTLNHVENPTQPELRGFEDFDVVFVGDRSLDFQRTVIINGRRRDMVRRGHQYTYRLTPRRTGLLRIPAPVATVDGRELSGPETTLQVVPAEAQNLVFLDLRVDRQTVYPMQPFTVTLSVAVKGLPEPFADRDPVSIQRELRLGPPVLKIPFVEDGRAKLPGGLAPEKDLNDWVSNLLNRQRIGFNINGLSTTSTSVFSMFEDRGLATFLPAATKTSRRDAQGQEAVYWQYEFSRTFIPGRIGRYPLGPVTVEGSFVKDIDARGSAEVEEGVYAVARPIELTVKDVPLEGRPASFTGAIGSFALEAELEPKERKVGDPMTLTLKLTGQGTLDQTKPPELERIPLVADCFKIYEATAQVKGDTCRFTYALRPQAAGIKEFPPIPVSYFDVRTERYVTLTSEAIPVRITEADRLSDDQIVAAQQNVPGTAGEIETRREGIFANITDPSAVRDERARPGRWLIALAGMVGFYAAAALVAGQVRRIGGDLGLARRRSAPGRARKRAVEAAALLAENRIREGCDLVYSSLVGLVADVADLPDAGMTPKDVDAQLGRLAVGDDLRCRVGRLLETCDAARYGAPGESGRLGHEAVTLVEEAIAALRAGRRFR
jgi:hypothetical protein